MFRSAIVTCAKRPIYFCFQLRNVNSHNEMSIRNFCALEDALCSARGHEKCGNTTHLARAKNTTIQREYSHDTMHERNDVCDEPERLPLDMDKCRHDHYNKSNRNADESIDLKVWNHVKQLFPTPVNTVHCFYQYINAESGKHNLSSRVENIGTPSQPNYKYIFQVRWPKDMVFSAKAHSKKAACTIAAWKCLYWMQINNRIRKNALIYYTNTEISNMNSEAHDINIESQFLHSMQNMLDIYDSQIKDTLQEESTYDAANYVYHELRIEKKVPISETRNTQLRESAKSRWGADRGLPIHAFRDQILELLESNQVVFISGGPGCGKSTQVPQFILDSFAMRGEATDCNILIAQPRRISAVSLARRVADERGENVGDVVGFKIRFDEILPKESGSILYCTTGILEQMLLLHRTFANISHVIVDECHERSIETDFTLLFLKELMTIYPNCKLIVMSASANTDAFRDYLKCPSLHIPSMVHPVKVHFLDDLEKMGVPINMPRHACQTLRVDYQNVQTVIRWIAANKPAGTILCFLPGWADIIMLEELLVHDRNISYHILKLHSKMDKAMQEQIFQQVPSDVRKIVLTTDIIETGITLTDARYIIDTAIKKDNVWNYRKGTTHLDHVWVPQALIVQRQGRVGRTSPGESYHLISKERYNNLPTHPVPKICCSSLVSAVFRTKLYTKRKIREFLRKMIEPPDEAIVDQAISDLRTIGAIDDNEDLTHLGKRMTASYYCPVASKLLIYSALFQCVNPIIHTMSIMQAPYSTLNYQSFHKNSDFLALAAAYDTWHSYRNKDSDAAAEFCRKQDVKPEVMIKAADVSREFVDALVRSKMAPARKYISERGNAFSHCDELVLAVVFAATNQLATISSGSFRKNRYRKSELQLITENGMRGRCLRSSINFNRTSWPTPCLTYYQRELASAPYMMVQLKDTNPISPITVLLFSQQQIQYVDEADADGEIVFQIYGFHGLTFRCKQTTLETLLQFRAVMWKVMNYIIREQGVSTDSLVFARVDEFKYKLLHLITEILHHAARDT